MSQQEDDLRHWRKSWIFCVREYIICGNQYLLVLLRGYPLMGSKYWGS